MHQLQVVRKSRINPNGSLSYQLAKVVYLVTKESGDSEVVGPVQPVFGRKVLHDVDAGEVE